MNLVTIIAAFVVYLVSVSFVTRTIAKIGAKKSVRAYRVKYITKTLNLALTALFVVVLFLLLGIEHFEFLLMFVYLRNRSGSLAN